MNLTKYTTNIENLELVIDQDTGEVYSSQAALARMCGVESTQIRRLIGGDTESLEIAPIMTSNGDKQIKLYPESLILKAIVTYNPELAMKCMEAGLRLFLHGMAGYKYEIAPKVTPKQESVIELANAAVTIENLSDPMMKAALTQYLCGTVGQPRLTGSKEPEKTTLTLRAKQLGFSQSVIVKNQLKLGQAVKKRFNPLGKTQKGNYEVNVYQLTPEFDQMITEYLAKS